MSNCNINLCKRRFIPLADLKFSPNKANWIQQTIHSRKLMKKTMITSQDSLQLDSSFKLTSWFQSMLNNISLSCPGHVTVSTALASMTNMAQHINEMKRKHDAVVHIQEISSQLHGWTGDDLTTLGDLILEVNKL